MSANNLVESGTGPLREGYEQARKDGTLYVGGFDDFVSPAGVPCGNSTAIPTVVLADTSLSDTVKVTGKMLARGGSRRRFEGGEHTAIGDSIQLTDENGRVAEASTIKIALHNGLQLTYGQIVALGGDFYGIPEKPISEGGSPEDRMQRFKNCFDSLAVNPDSKKEAALILAAMQLEIEGLRQALIDGSSPSDVYEKLGQKLNAIWNVITGGGDPIVRATVWATGASAFAAFDNRPTQYANLIPSGRYLNLASSNYDHFGSDAYLAYIAGHTAALQCASAAGKLSNPGQRHDGLMLAYAYNAFADHFLSDLFSAGHMRTPRKLIYTSSWAGAGVTANLCAKGMHDEDNRFGLFVENKNGQKWRAYGDGHFFATVNLPNLDIAEAAIQASVNDVYRAFQGANLAQADWAVAKLVPTPFPTKADSNFSAMFIDWRGEVQRRNDLNDLNDYTWSKYWATGTTATKLLTTYSPNNPKGFLTPPPTAATVTRTASGPAPLQVRYMMSFIGPTFESDLGPASPYYATAAGDTTRMTAIPRPPNPGDKKIQFWRQVKGEAIKTCFFINATADPNGFEFKEGPGHDWYQPL